MVTVNRPEQRSFADAGSGTPLLKCNYWTPSAPAVRDADLPTRAVLICFRTAEGDLETLTDRNHIFAVEADQFRTAEAASET